MSIFLEIFVVRAFELNPQLQFLGTVVRAHGVVTFEHQSHSPELLSIIDINILSDGVRLRVGTIWQNCLASFLICQVPGIGIRFGLLFNATSWHVAFLDGFLTKIEIYSVFIRSFSNDLLIAF